MAKIKIGDPKPATQLTQEEWEEILKNVLSAKNPGYIDPEEWKIFAKQAKKDLGKLASIRRTILV